MSGDIPIGDLAAAELDRRKIQKLIDDGVLETQDIANAPIVEMQSELIEFPYPHEHQKIISVTCQMGECGRVLKDLHEFEEHLALDHFALTYGGE